jgi:NADP-dependent 3-hydroxy acid dehydrogenase YdfG
MQVDEHKQLQGAFDMNKTWFIRGASRGFGRIRAEAALKRGDKVTATARRLEDIADLKERFGDSVLSMALDVTNAEQVPQIVRQAYKHFGRLDVLVNNAGTSLFAATEEASDEQIRGLFDANYLGMVRVLRSALSLLRKQGSGHILGVSSGLGITALPLIRDRIRQIGTNRRCPGTICEVPEAVSEPPCQHGTWRSRGD